jgi:hypothetical protein
MKFAPGVAIKVPLTKIIKRKRAALSRATAIKIGKPAASVKKNMFRRRRLILSYACQRAAVLKAPKELVIFAT